MVGPWTFRFLNEERTLDPARPWRPVDAPLLWLYNLHYFDDLNAACSAERSSWHQALIESWISANPPASEPGWDSYPTSLRISNWIKWSLSGGRLAQRHVASLAQQVRWLEGRIEWHLLGNHLFANAKALIFAGCFFSGPEARRWLAKGSRIALRELPEQVLSDGGNFELTPMYHSIFLADVLDLINVAQAFPGKIAAELEEALRRRAASMLRWLEAMVHPDGEIALFNDSAMGIAPSLAELKGYAARLSIEASPQEVTAAPKVSVTYLAASGYARLETAEAVAICDIARVGPDYLPGHAHADTLSFEMSIFGRRFIVNGGTSRYGSDNARVLERGTGAHSTVLVDNQDSSEVWSGFRVARRARPFGIGLDQSADAIQLRASHDGYRRLHRDIIPQRTWTLSQDSLLIEDRVAGPWVSAVAQFVLHHDVAIQPLSANSWSLTHAKAPGRMVRFTVFLGQGRIQDTFHSLEFGQRLRTHALLVDLERAGAKVQVAWQ